MPTKVANQESPATPQTAQTSDTSEPYVHQWNALVSQTNWEKGRIICAWRDTLAAANSSASNDLASNDASATYSDEAWAERVGHVTGQHVGRLRRVFERFGSVHEEYPKLFWSHFQVAIDWDDSEMWLEGSVQNGWSVSQMRAKRWETLGAPESLRPRDEDIVMATVDEDAGPLLEEESAVRGVGTPDESETEEDETAEHETTASAEPRSAKRSSPAETESSPSHEKERQRPFEKLPELPDDLAEAFEQFKVAILAHKMTDWNAISQNDVFACLDALKELAITPAGD